MFIVAQQFSCSSIIPVGYGDCLQRQVLFSDTMEARPTFHFRYRDIIEVLQVCFFDLLHLHEDIIKNKVFITLILLKVWKKEFVF